ncbi:MAG: tetratricopeptide repeat protein, partial [Polyangiales bacterium]
EPLAVALEATQRDADAARILVRLRDARPDHETVSARLGFAHARLGQHAEAAAAFEVSRAREKPRVDVLTALAAAHAALKDEPARRTALEALVKLAPDDLPAHRALGLAHDAAGRRDEAIAILGRADDLAKGGDPDLRHRLGQLLLERAAKAASASAAGDDLARARRLSADDPDLLIEVARAYSGRDLYREAAASAREVLALVPADVDAALLLGKVLAADGDARGAADAFELALRHRVDAIEALVGAGRAYLSLGKPDDAISMLRRAVSVDANRRDAHQPLAETLRARGRGADAVQSYQEVVRLAPDDADAWRALGDLHLELAQPREAAVALEKTIALRPDDGSALLALATANERLGKSGDSLSALERAHRARPDDAESAARYGAALADAGEIDGAIGVLDKARALDAKRAEVVRRLVELRRGRAARLEKEDDAKRAESDFAAALALAPDDVELRLGVARAQRAQGKTHEALATAEEATTRAPEHAAAWLLLGEMCSKLAHDAKAAEAYARAVRYDDRSFEARVGLATVRVRLGETEAAVADFARASELRPEATEVHLELARLHDAAGRTAEAASALARLAALRALSSDESRRHGMLAAAIEDHATAATALAAARPAFADDDALLLALASAHLRLGRFDDAIEPLEQLARIEPEHPKASALLGLAYGRVKR